MGQRALTNGSGTGNVSHSALDETPPGASRSRCRTEDAFSPQRLVTRGAGRRRTLFFPLGTCRTPAPRPFGA